MKGFDSFSPSAHGLTAPRSGRARLSREPERIAIDAAVGGAVGVHGWMGKVPAELKPRATTAIAYGSLLQ